MYLEGREEPIVFDEEIDPNAIHANLIACIRGEEERRFAPASEAIKATLLIDDAYASAGRIEQVSWADMAGVEHLMDYAAAQCKLFSELGGWGHASEAVEIDEDFRFDGLADD